MPKETIEQLEQDLFEVKDGSKFIDLLLKYIKKYASHDRERVIESLMRYAKEGQITFHRGFVVARINEIVADGEENYGDFYKWAITIPELTHWGIIGYLKTMGRSAYPLIIEVMTDGSHKMETRAKAIKILAAYSKQNFDRDLPYRVGRYWEKGIMRFDEVLEWQKKGYPDGEGYQAPKIHPSLNNPQTELELIVAALDKKLEKERKNQDMCSPSGWLVIADEKDMTAVKNKWVLPADYLLFLQNFSPLRVNLYGRKFINWLRLYGANDILQNQDGYSYNSIKKEELNDWPTNLVVIADDGADPYCLDISKIKDNDAPVYRSNHGEGSWDFKLYAKSFKEFLIKITK